jgi:hypothetical protein
VDHDFNTIYDILDAFRRRPALFVGNSFRKEPFAVFLAFLARRAEFFQDRSQHAFRLGFQPMDHGPSGWDL